MSYVFFPPQIHTAAIDGSSELFPVNRIFCVGRNYAAHTREMGLDPDREPPFYFTKSASTISPTGSDMRYPPESSNFHHEMEFVIAIGKAGFRVSEEQADDLIFGYACGLDMTRRDLQLVAREKGRPWCLGKDIEDGAVISPIHRKAETGSLETGRIWLKVNDEIRQDSDLGNLIWSPRELISNLSKFYHLEPGDLIYTGTPAGVGPVEVGDKISGGIDGLGDIHLQIIEAEV
jgi:fumarylpyruvate hydrolase